MRIWKYIVIFLAILIMAFTPSKKAQVNKSTKIKSLLRLAESDRKQKIERLAALKFHKLINDYRKQNKLCALAWDEALWVTCRNHSIWMGENAILAHEEKKGTNYFTGVEPGDRYKYTTSGKGKCEWSGENALYNYDAHGNTIKEISDNMAMGSFEQWKHSPGHNQNMLGQNHKVHGVAFYMNDEGVVYATDLFAYNVE